VHRLRQHRRNTPPSITGTANGSTRRRSRRQIQLELIETSKTQLDDTDDNDNDADYVDDDDDDDESSGPTTPTTATVNVPTGRRRSSRHVISTRSTGNPPPPPTATVEASSRRQSRRQIQLPPIDTSEVELDDDVNYVDGGGDLLGPTPPPFATMNALTRRRSSRRVIPTSSTGTPVSPPTATMEASSRRQSRRQIQTKFPSSEAQLDDDDNGALSATPWEDRLIELADYRKLHGHCNVPRKYSRNAKLGTWVSIQRSQYKLHLLEGKKSCMTYSRIQELEGLGLNGIATAPAGKIN
jgi:hypothetical protein